MSEMIKKALTDKEARNAKTLQSVASMQVMIPWGG
jgi:hypothetical protein